MKKILPYLLPQPRDILFIGVFFVMLLGGPKLFSNDSDLGRHITIGNYILDEGRFPTVDVFSHTRAGDRLVMHEWLADVVFATAHRVMGLNGDVLIAALLAAITIMLVYNELIRRGALRFVGLFVAAWVAVVSSIHWLARPHMFTFFFIAVWAYGLERVYEKQYKNIWHFPVLMLIWANTHGAFFAGFLILAAYAANWFLDRAQKQQADRVGKQLFQIGVFSLAATLINPSGWRLWTAVLGFLGNSYITDRQVDHASPNFHETDMWPFLFMLVFALLALAMQRKVKPREAFLLAGWGALSLFTLRNIPLFAVVTAPMFGSLLQQLVEDVFTWLNRPALLRESKNILRGYVWSAVAVLFFGVALWRGIPLDQKGTGNIFLPDRMPVQAITWLEENPQTGNMFNYFIWGGYILYRDWPRERVFIDGQTDFYGEEIFRDYLEVMAMADGWEQILDKYNVVWMLIPVKESLAQRLKTDQSDPWNVIYEDETAIILRREPAAP